MKTFAGCTLCVLLLVSLSACNTLNRQPQIKSLTITPNDLKPGDSAVILADVKDPRHIIRRLEGVVLEDPSVKFKLRDDGMAPDAEAADNVWSFQVDVPPQAPPGEYEFELTAYRSDGTPVPVKNREHGRVPLKATAPVVIRKL